MPRRPLLLFVLGSVGFSVLSVQVAPVVGVIPAGTRLRPQASEVAAVFTAPLHMFVDGCPGYYSRDVEWEKGIPYR